MSSSRPDDAEITRWALAAKAGDRAAAAAFIRATQHGVHRFLSHLADAGDVEDLSQETYLRAMRGLPRFDARSSANTWLLSSARRAAADHVRRAMRRPRLVPVADWEMMADARAEATGSGFDGDVLLRRLLAGLEPDRREAFVATQVLGLSYAEAAQVCGCPVGTIRSRVSRARDSLVAAVRAGDERTGRRETAP
jgi:RNA polymerase sigma-70 factor (ECF subfamily)